MESCDAVIPPGSGTPAASEGRAAPVAGALLLALLVVGCSQANSTRLPELASLPSRVLSDEEQKMAVEEMKARRETHRAEAIKKIQGAQSR